MNYMHTSTLDILDTKFKLKFNVMKGVEINLFENR